MNKRFFYIAVVTFFVFMAGCIATSQLVNITNPNFLQEAGVDKDFNPHTGESCNVCHLAPVDVLKMDNPSKKQALERRAMRTDLLSLCDDCHKASGWKHHPTGIATPLNLKNLPLDGKGLINCATTCHNVHAVDEGLVRGKLRDKFDDLCLCCHDY